MGYFGSVVLSTYNSTNEEYIELSDNIVMFPGRPIGDRHNVYEGEVRSSVYGTRSCAIKFAEHSEQNLREAEILIKLGSHTNVIAIIQSGTYCDVFEDRVYIALDKCHDENLRQYLANRKAAGIEFDLNQAIDFAKQMIVGVMYIHDNNVIHLDLKPSNILISQNLRLIKLADFGLSIIVKSPKSKVFHKRQFGTNGYRPIESFGNGEVSMRTDIFSLGTVFLHVLSNGNDAFGCDDHTFIHNVMNDIADTSGLLVSNPLTTEHLFKCMVNKERSRRPTIWEVSDHPCWSGKEVECDFEYFAEDEIEEIAPNVPEILTESPEYSETNVAREREFIQRMRDMGFNRMPTMVLFDSKERYLYRFDERQNKTTRMHGYHIDMTYSTFVRPFTAVALGEYIYVFTKYKTVYRLEYGDDAATWEKMVDCVRYHGDLPPVATSEDAIFLVGVSTDLFTDAEMPSKIVSKFDPSLNQWTNMEDKNIATNASALLCHQGYLYCFGGATAPHKRNPKVERMNLTTSKWSAVTSMRRARYGASAVECRGNIYVLGGHHNRLVEMYDPLTDQWTDRNGMIESRFHFRCFSIDETFFAVGGDIHGNTIERYDVTKDKWDIIGRIENFVIQDSVLVRLSR